MSSEQVLEQIRASVGRILQERGEEHFHVDRDTQLLGTEGLGIDSLDLATLVVELQQITGKDPFEGGFVEFQTAGQLADLYSDS